MAFLFHKPCNAIEKMQDKHDSHNAQEFKHMLDFCWENGEEKKKGLTSQATSEQNGKVARSISEYITSRQTHLYLNHASMSGTGGAPNCPAAYYKMSKRARPTFG